MRTLCTLDKWSTYLLGVFIKIEIVSTGPKVIVEPITERLVEVGKLTEIVTLSDITITIRMNEFSYLH